MRVLEGGGIEFTHWQKQAGFANMTKAGKIVNAVLRRHDCIDFVCRILASPLALAKFV